jgi:hypothetical protein
MMPRYYFDIVVGTERLADVDGNELPDVSAARTQAHQEIRALLSARTVAMLDPKDCHLEVSDAAHCLLFTVDLMEAFGPNP